MPRTIIYPGTFDPIHNGHIDLIKRISLQYDNVIVAVVKDCGSKTPWLEFNDRLELTSLAVQELKLNNVITLGMKIQFPFFAKQHNATAMLRGIRNSDDLDHEVLVTNILRSPTVGTLFQSSFEVICLLTPQIKNLSSTKIRAMISNDENIDCLVPSVVSQQKYKYLRVKDHSSITMGTKDLRLQLLSNTLTLWDQHKATIVGTACGYLAGKGCAII